MRLRSISLRREACHAPQHHVKGYRAATMTTGRRQQLEEDPVSHFLPTLGALTRELSLRSLEAVACAANSFKIAGFFRVRFDFSRMRQHRRRPSAGSHTKCRANRIQKMIARENAAEMAREVIEQTKLGGGGRDGLPANGQHHGGGIDFDFAT